MLLSQRYIDLLNVPTPQLRAAGEAKQYKHADKMSRSELLTRLSVLQRAEIESLTEGYLYAGRTSISWFRIDEKLAPKEDGAEAEPETEADDGTPAVPAPLSGVSLHLPSVRDALNELSQTGDAFDEEDRPEQVAQTPTLVYARELPGGSFLLTFVQKKRVSRVIHNFHAEDVLADDFFNAVLHPKEGLVEVRTSHTNAQRFQRSWLEGFANQFSDCTTFPVTISQDDFDALKNELGAGMTLYRGKDGDGSAIDTVELSLKETRDDLVGTPEFDEKSEGLEQVHGNLKFEFGDKPYTMRVSRLQGSVYFITPAPEVTIAHVRDALRRVKVRHLVAS